MCLSFETEKRSPREKKSANKNYLEKRRRMEGEKENKITSVK